MKKRLAIVFLYCLTIGMAVGQKTKLTPKQKEAKNFIYDYNTGRHNVYKIDSIPKDGILINKGWRYDLSDNIAYLNKDFDDKKWKLVAIDSPMKEYSVAKKQIGWFRKKIFIDSSLVNKPYSLKILLTGAAEIYLNGKLVTKIGNISKNRKNDELLFSNASLPYNLTFNNSGEQQIAVRFLFSEKVDFANSLDMFPLSIRIQKLDGFIKEQIARSTNRMLANGIFIGLFFMTALIHFFFHRFFRRQQFNILFSISMLIFAIYFGFSSNSDSQENLEYFIFLSVSKDILFPLAHLVLLIAVYDYLQYPKRIIFWGVFLVFVSVHFAKFFLPTVRDYAGFSYLILIANYIILIVQSSKNKSQNGKVMLNAIVTFLVILCLTFVFLVVYVSLMASNLYNPQSAGYHLGSSSWFSIILVLFMAGPQLSVSAAISLSLAKEFVKTNFLLKQKLDEIEALSAEKQQLLASQNEILEHQVKERTDELHQSLEHLKATQTQLIQSEKLASLGELTAGIAHEIQNPLNFVNNFSELSFELIDEIPSPPENSGEDWIPEEIPYGGWGAFFGDLKANLQKINLHGKRASSIIKGMLEHSRTNSGTKEATDIAKLADEYLRLSFHGLRAKDKSFNANFELIADETLPKANIIPQDIGRVLLNLINNAFYAVNQQRQNLEKTTNPSNGDLYKPSVLVSIEKNKTNKAHNQVVIKISDNGSGMPEAVKAKIFQPFFTTKPTGQGTGLGLSLAYDIITKGHGGTVECESMEGNGTTFTINLPI